MLLQWPAVSLSFLHTQLLAANCEIRPLSVEGADLSGPKLLGIARAYDSERSCSAGKRCG